MRSMCNKVLVLFLGRGVVGGRGGAWLEELFRVVTRVKRGSGILLLLLLEGMLW
jgi:hypothetical protein